MQTAGIMIFRHGLWLLGFAASIVISCTCKVISRHGTMPCNHTSCHTLKLKTVPSRTVCSGFRISVLVFIAMILIISCTKLPPFIGKSRSVVVLSSVLDTATVVNNLQVYNYVPQKEGVFDFLFAPDTAVKKFQRFHTLLLYGSLQDEFIYTLLSPEARTATETDTNTLFRLDNLWVNNQLVIVLASAQPDYITRGLQRYGPIISKILQDNYYERTKQSYYNDRIDRRISEKLRKFGMVLDFQRDWMIDSTFRKENFMIVHTHFPDRSIFLYREPIQDSLTSTSVISKRNDLTKKFYNGDYVLKELTTVDNVDFRGMKGLRMKGTWQNDSLVAGGPFLSYFFMVKDTLYIVDAIVFNPGERKSDYIMKNEVIMNSLEITHP